MYEVVRQVHMDHEENFERKLPNVRWYVPLVQTYTQLVPKIIYVLHENSKK